MVFEFKGERHHVILKSKFSSSSRIHRPNPVFGSYGIIGYRNIAISNGQTIVIRPKGSIGPISLSSVMRWSANTTSYVDSTKTDYYLGWLFWLLIWLRLDLLNKATRVLVLYRKDAYNKVFPIPLYSQQEHITTVLKEKMTQMAYHRVDIEKQFKSINTLYQALLRKPFKG